MTSIGKGAASTNGIGEGRRCAAQHEEALAGRHRQRRRGRLAGGARQQRLHEDDELARLDGLQDVARRRFDGDVARRCRRTGLVAHHRLRQIRHDRGLHPVDRHKHCQCHESV